jgi:hypothetical protein
MIVDSGAYRTILSCDLKDRLGLGRGQWPKEEAVMDDGTVLTGEIIDLQLLFVDKADRQLTIYVSVMFLPIQTSMIGQDILRQLKSEIGQTMLSLTCDRATLKFPMSTIPGDLNILIISDNMPNFNDDERQGGSRGRGCAAEAHRIHGAPVRPEQVERQKIIQANQQRLKERFGIQETGETVTVEAVETLVDVINLDQTKGAEKRKGFSDGATARYGDDQREAGIIPLMQGGSKKEDQRMEVGCKEKGSSSKAEAREGGGKAAGRPTWRRSNFSTPQ